MRLGMRATNFQPGSEWSKLRALYSKSHLSPKTNHSPNCLSARSLNARRHHSVSNTVVTTGSSSALTFPMTAKELIINERHRHRYEVNVHYKACLERTGMRFSGMSPDGILPEIIEIPDHPWFVGVQYHPELKSKPFDPHPLFAGFIAAAVRQARLV